MKDFLNSSKLLVLIITIGIFIISYFVGIANVIIYSLSFLILMEIVRTIVEYIMNPEHRVKIRYIIDGGILFSIRELFVGMVMMKTSLLLSLVIIGTSMLVLGGLIFYRYKVIISSPDVLEKK